MGKNFNGKVGESDVIKIPIHDPRSTTPDTNSYISVVLDFTISNPPYQLKNNKNTGEGYWWYYDSKSNIVHILIAEEIRKEFVDLMKIRNNLTSEEKNSLNACSTVLDITPHIGAQQAVNTYPDYILGKITTPDNEKNSYRTKKNAGITDEIPSQVPAITNKSYQNAMTLNFDDKAYLQPISGTDRLMYENGQLLFEGFPATAATLKRYYTSDEIENFDLPLLRVFYGIILNRFSKTWQEDKSIEDVVTLYYPDLAKMLGKSPNINQKNVNSCINNILSFQTIMGIINKGEKGNDILPVLVYMGNDVEKNTISFASPYMVRVIRDIYNASIRKSKKEIPILKKNGTPQMLPSYSYMIKSSIAKEKNKKAVEIIFIVVALIEQCGNNEPHIKARTIIERNQLLKQALERCKTPGNINNTLTRAFTKAWKLLITHTTLKERYRNIQLPDTDAKDFKALWIPTSSSLDKVFSFKHDGKIRK